MWMGDGKQPGSKMWDIGVVTGIGGIIAPFMVIPVNVSVCDACINALPDKSSC